MTRLRARDHDYERPADVPEGSVLSIFRVAPEDEGMRLDVFLRGEMKRTSRTRAQVIIKASAYDEHGKRMRPNDRVRAEQRILLWRPPWDETPVARDIGVLYEDEFVLVVDKPANLPVHPTARYYRNTLIRLLQDERPGQFLSLAHRIDRETSGVLFLGKTPEADRLLKKQLEDREGVEKTYTAITWGLPAGPAGERAFRYERRMKLDEGNRLGVKMCLADGPDSMHSATVFEVTGSRQGPRGPYGLVRCDLETGRQHQIRLHLASLGAPIVGDKLYGPDDALFARGADGELTDEDLDLLELPRHALHASRMALAHPMTGRRLVVESPLPEDLRAFWESMDPV